MLNSEDIKSSLKATDYETANYPPEHDSTSSGGSGSPEDAWSKSAQRGKHFPTHLTGIPPNSASSTTAIYSPDPYSPARPFTPLNSSGLPITSPSTPVPAIPATAPADPGSDPDSWETKNEALQRLNQRYRDSNDP